MELESDAAAVKRLAIGVSAAAVMGLTALPLLATSGADLLERLSGVSRTVWLAGIGAALLVAAVGLGWSACRRFRRHVVALNETLEELREDLVWLEEWSGGRDQGSGIRDQGSGSRDQGVGIRE
jgi:hypothetical protein